MECGQWEPLSSCNSRLNAMPLEIYLLILEEIQHPEDLKNLCLVSWGLYRVTLAKLYEYVTLRLDGSFSRFDVEDSLQGQVGKGSLQFVKHLSIAGPLSQDQQSHVHCYHGRVGSGQNLKQSANIKLIATHLKPLLRMLPKNSLETISWDIEVCMPGTVLEIFSSCQTAIRSISFPSKNFCCFGLTQERRDAFIRFQNFQNISCLCTDEDDIGLVQGCVAANSSHLRSLSISFDGTSRPPEFWTQLFTVSSFPVLRKLCIRDALLPKEPHLFRSDILNRLYTLKLQHCVHAPEFLSSFVDLGGRIQLRSLELILKISDADEACERDFDRVFQACQSIQELYFNVIYGSNTYNPVSGSIATHCTSLRRLIYHERMRITIDSDDDYGSYEDDDIYQRRLDYGDFDIEPDQDVTPFGRSDFTKLLQNEPLTCVGFCERPGALKSQLQLAGVGQGWKLLHTRTCSPIDLQNPKVASCRTLYPSIFANFQYPVVPLSTKKEVLEFAEWAFSSQGLQKLLILAYGDFTDRQGTNSYIFCREFTETNDKTFRMFSRKDEYLWDCIPGGATMLTSCAENATPF